LGKKKVKRPIVHHKKSDSVWFEFGKRGRKNFVGKGSSGTT